ncbi:hypothetical protein ABZ876_30735 [Streptomyces sp. NPDC046931]|uniref:hypothetical protein n=1 Tax=Streptomyces sp. NPDC046931 TaxID=3154806 RepID=UPI0033E8C8A5
MKMSWRVSAAQSSAGREAQDQVEAVGGGGKGVVDLQEADGSRAQVGVGAVAGAEDLVEEVAVLRGATDVDDGGVGGLERVARDEQGVGPAGTFQAVLEATRIEVIVLECVVGVCRKVAQEGQTVPVRRSEHTPHVDPVRLVPAQDAVGHALELGQTIPGVLRHDVLTVDQLVQNAERGRVARRHPGRDGLTAARVGGQQTVG